MAFLIQDTHGNDIMGGEGLHFAAQDLKLNHLENIASHVAPDEDALIIQTDESNNKYAIIKYDALYDSSVFWQEDIQPFLEDGIKITYTEGGETKVIQGKIRSVKDHLDQTDRLFAQDLNTADGVNTHQISINQGDAGSVYGVLEYGVTEIDEDTDYCDQIIFEAEGQTYQIKVDDDLVDVAAGEELTIFIPKAVPGDAGEGPGIEWVPLTGKIIDFKAAGLGTYPVSVNVAGKIFKGKLVPLGTSKSDFNPHKEPFQDDLVIKIKNPDGALHYYQLTLSSDFTGFEPGGEIGITFDTNTARGDGKDFFVATVVNFTDVKLREKFDLTEVNWDLDAPDGSENVLHSYKLKIQEIFDKENIFNPEKDYTFNKMASARKRLIRKLENLAFDVQVTPSWDVKDKSIKLDVKIITPPTQFKTHVRFIDKRTGGPDDMTHLMILDQMAVKLKKEGKISSANPEEMSESEIDLVKKAVALFKAELGREASQFLVR